MTGARHSETLTEILQHGSLPTRPIGFRLDESTAA